MSVAASKVLTLLVCAQALVSTGSAIAQQLPYAKPAEESHEAPKAGNLIDELFVGEKLYVQEKNEWYLIVEAAYAKNSDEKEYELAAELRYSVTDQLQLSVEAPYVIVDDDDDTHHGVGDVSLAVNFNFIEREDFTLAARVAASIPTGDEDRGLGDGQFAWQPELLAAVRVGRGEIYAGVGADFGDDADHFIYTLAGAYPIVEHFKGILELSGSTGDGEDVAYLTPGVAWAASEHLRLQAGVPIGLTNDSDDFLVIGQVIIEF